MGVHRGAAAQVCPEPGCPNLIPCKEHKARATAAFYGSRRGGSTRRWREKTRPRILRRDPICMACGERPSAHVDHIVPDSEGGTDDDWNLQGLCVECHGTKTGQEGRRAQAIARSGAVEVILVCGPPCSGKSTYVDEHREPGDLIIDRDRICAALTGLPGHERPESGVSWYADYLYRVALAKLERDPERISKAWIVHGAGSPSRRRQAQARFGCDVVVMDTPKEECFRRLEKADRPDKNEVAAAIEAWH